MNKHLIWVFQELVVLILKKLKGGGNVDTISDCVINHELDYMNLYLLLDYVVSCKTLGNIKLCMVLQDIERF